MATVKEYKSVEEIILNTEISKTVGNFIKYGGKGFYGIVASIFRIPTPIRKHKNKQTLLDKTEVNEEEIVTGAVIGAFADIGIIGYSIHQAFEQNYIPLTILGVTNLASGLYELDKLK